MKKTIITLVAIALLAAGGGAYYYSRPKPEPKVTTATASRGDIVQTVRATGTLDTLTAVQVGSQVGGIIQELPVDFNDVVKKGDVLLRINPDTINTQIEQAKATLVQREADLEQRKVNVEDATVKLRRTRELFAKRISTQADLDTAEVSLKSAQASLRSSEASLGQAKANLSQQEVNLRNTIITSPIDGIVVDRKVDVGQTVQASYQSPTLFVIGADLTKMKCTANIDESEVGKIRPGQRVRFRIDAYPTDTFTGTVVQVRLQPVVVQNVVTYGTVIDVPNPDFKLRPGMTATVDIEIARRTDVMRIPRAAVQFRPTAEVFEALNQPLPPELQPRTAGRRGDLAAGNRGTTPGQPAAPAGGQTPAAPGARPGTAPTGAAPGATPSAAPGAPGRTFERGGGDRGAMPSTRGNGSRQPGAEGRGGGEGRQGMGGRGFDPNDPEARARMAERLKQMTPEQREQFMARMKERGVDMSRMGGATPATSAARPAVNTGSRETIDALFGTLPTRITSGRAWIWLKDKKQLKSVQVRLGIDDGNFYELIEGDVQADMELAINILLGNEATRPGGQSGSPLMQQQQRGGMMGPGGPGGFGGGGGRR